MIEVNWSKLPGFLLAGGRSSRLGQEKARAFLYEGISLIKAVHESVEQACTSWVVVADEVDKYADLGLRTIADETPHQGPLGGLLRAAQEAGEGYFFVVGCDRIGLKAQWVELLKQALEQEPGAGAAAFYFQGRWEPLFGIYHGRLAATIEERLSRGQGALWGLLEAVDALKVEAPPEWGETFSVNRPEDLKRAQRIWAARFDSEKE